VAGSAIKVPNSISRLAIACLVLASFTTTWGGLRVLPAGQIGDAFLALSFAFVLGLVVFTDLRFTTPFWMWIPPIAVVLVTAIRWFDPVPYWQTVTGYTTTPFAPNNLPKAAAWLVALIVVPLVIIGCTKLNPRTPQLVIGAFTAGVCVSSAVAISDLMGYTRIAVTYGMQNEVETRALGLTTHSLFLGVTCVISIPFAMYFLHTGRHKWIPAIALLLLFGGALASGSRGAQAASVCVAAVMVVAAPNRKASFVQSLLGLGLAGVIVVAFAQLFLGNVLGELVRFGGGTVEIGTSDQTRTSAARQAFEDMQNHPIAGVGIKAINNAHGIYFQLLQAGGVILLIAVLVYWIWCLRDAYLVEKLGHPIARYLFVSIAAWLTLGVIENQLIDRLLYYSIGCVAALSAIYLGARNGGGESSEQPSVDEPPTAPSSDTDQQLHDSRR
jgi:hypothetical protein